MRYAIALCLLCLVGCGGDGEQGSGLYVDMADYDGSLNHKRWYVHTRERLMTVTACDTTFVGYDERIVSGDRLVWCDTTFDKSWDVAYNDYRTTLLGPIRTVWDLGGLTTEQMDSIIKEDWFHESVGIIR